jgi:hypothetical protein
LAIRKHKLGYTEDFDFLLLGLASTENDYRLIWKINQTFNFTFERCENHKVLSKDGEKELGFSHYTFNDENTLLFYRLLSNKTEKGVLLEELKNIDYLLIVHGEFQDSFITGLIANLKSVEHIQGVFHISPASLKSRERLLF